MGLQFGFSYAFLVCSIARVVTSDYYDCSEPLLDKAVLKATSSLRDRGPENARLNEDNAWTASSSDNDQALIVDLGQIMKVTGISTQGRPHSLEYTMEYSISYGSNGWDYAAYKDPRGNTKMFGGNMNGDDIKYNSFDVPIIAQWIRINPTRWRDRISLRMELYGCEYVSENMHFNGSALIRWNLHNEPISATRESIRFRFKTSQADGILLYGRGTQGDFIALQLRHNRMLLNIDLGSGITTSLSVGSLLDDNIWHDVVISRNRRDIIFSVDRVMIEGKVKGEFSRLNLNRQLYLGGVPNIQEGLIVSQNFTGCMENVYINSTNLISEVKQAYASGEQWLIDKYTQKHTLYTCPETHVIPVSFVTPNSYALLKGYEGINTFNVSFSFRTYEQNGLLLYHKFSSKGYVKFFLELGKAKVEIQTMNNPPTLLDNYEESFTDGRWHHCILSITTNSLIINIDDRPMFTTRVISMTTGSDYYIAGGISGHDGFVGCMQMITIDSNYKLPTEWKEGVEYFSKGDVVFDVCRMIDRCNPNPCEHGGICSQTSHEFLCDCQSTGYSGEVCHSSLNPLSCEAYRNVNPVGDRAKLNIDVDGSGPLPPFPVTCEYYTDGRTMTVVHHSNEELTLVDGHQERGSFVQDITYEADMRQLEALTNRSAKCFQHIEYRCQKARLLNSPSAEQNFRPFSWWVSRHNQPMDYWGGSIPGSRKCHCGLVGSCTDPTKWCNCDSGLDSELTDEGELTDKNELPVRQLRFGDTGTPLDDKLAYYKLGPLLCEGDDLFDNVVTFRISDASIDLPTFDMGHGGDIYFEFRTTVENAVIFHSKGPSDFIQLAILGGNALVFTYQAGDSPQRLKSETAYKLADDKWHSVSVERNRKEARLVIDGSAKVHVKESGPVRAMHLTSPLVIGSTVDYRDGFTGCIRALLLNGQHVDLRSYAEKGLYGVMPGCVGKCESNPCLNNGTCHEKYDGYWCDCRWTSFKGPICADEIGVNLRPSVGIKYMFTGSWRSTISEKIRVGFTTTNPKGFLLGMFSDMSGEYMIIMVSNSGHLRVVFDFGFERQELIFPNKHFGLGQYHDVRITRKNAGSLLIMQVDNYEPKEFKFDIKASADAQFNNIQYLYIGRNESMTEGFTGCVSRVEFDDIYPLKLMFQEDGPANIRSLSGIPLNEDFCGVEPVTHPPNIIETRPPPDVDHEKLKDMYSEPDAALVGGIVALILIVMVLIALLIGRYIARHKGEYLTQEDHGADTALDPDSAVVSSATGHQVQKKREWFI